MNRYLFSSYIKAASHHFSKYLVCSVVLLWLTGCAAPIGVTKITPEESYQIATENPLSHSGKLNNDTKGVLHRFNLLELYNLDPREAILSLHQAALKDDRRDLLFSLAEISYAYGETLSENTEEGSTTQAQDVFLQSAVYAYLYLESTQKLRSQEFK